MEQGFSLVRGVLTSAQQHEPLAAIGSVQGAGRRGLLAIPAVAELARSPKLIDLVRSHLNAEPRPVRTIYFDKSSDSNWLVAWHQDLTLALQQRVEVPGFGPWSLKHGIPHAQASVELLQQMLTVRLHFDDADESNGALRVLSSTHCLGRLSAVQIQELSHQQGEVICRASAGDALLMRPLLVHASSRSTSVRRRRVLHIEYAGFALPDGLDWHEAA